VEYSVEESSHVQSALEKINVRLPSLIILDLMMKGETGFEFLEYRRRLPDLARVPVIVASSLNDFGSVFKAISLGASDYLVKPFDTQLLVQKVQKLLKDPSFMGFQFEEKNRPRVRAILSVQVKSVTEVGFLLEIPAKLVPGDSLSVRSDLLDELGHTDFPLRAVASEFKLLGDRSVYLTDVVAAGVGEEAARKIRKVIRLWK
jgi:CheY-like chemotaxis protein